MSAATTPVVRPGQVWECLAKYDRGRTFKVLRVEFDSGKGADAAVCEILTNSDHTQALIDDQRTPSDLRPSDRRGHETRIRVDRFQPNGSGYRLVRDGSTGDAEGDAETADIGALIAMVHERLGGGVDIQTFSNGTAEVRWRRLYRLGVGDHGELSDERFVSARGLVTALQDVLAFEDDADRADAAQMAAEAER